VSAAPLGYHELNHAMREMWEALSIEVPFSEIVPLPPSNGITSPSPAVQVKKKYYIEDFGLHFLAYYRTWQQALASYWLNVADSSPTFLKTDQSYAALNTSRKPSTFVIGQLYST
jgi:hypothetical protein